MLFEKEGNSFVDFHSTFENINKFSSKDQVRFLRPKTRIDS